jgi:hypothetical protein
MQLNLPAGLMRNKESEETEGRTGEVGLENQTPVAEGIGIDPEETRITGKIRQVTIKAKQGK